jgi:serine/threonine-protein kinase
LPSQERAIVSKPAKPDRVGPPGEGHSSPSPRPSPQPRPAEPPLTLADSHHEAAASDANQGVDPNHNGHAGGSNTPRSGSSSKPSLDALGESAAGASAGELTTGGFETVFGKLVVDRGLVSGEEIEMCNAMLREAGSADSPRTLADVLVENRFITERQLTRLRTDFEANRSSQQIPGFKIIRKLGAGAMATVFLARQLSLDRMVAIKVLPQKFSANAKFIERFYKEGRAAAKLNHPNIVAAYDVGQAGEHHYFVMEYVDGPTVYDRIVKHKRFSEAEAVDIVIQVARALEHAHERGFIHRDIKPKNIMSTSKGVVKLADLGLARAMSDKEAAEAESGRAYGTPYYISPEQIRGEVTIGPQADIYGLGATFYHMVTGRVPFEGKNPSEVMHKHLKDSLKPPDHVNPKLSAGCAQVIEMAMAKSRNDRYRSVADLIEDLELVKQGLSPHYAGKGMGLSGITSSITTAATAPAITQPIIAPRPEPTKLSDSPVFWVVLAMAVISMLLNIVLAILALG